MMKTFKSDEEAKKILDLGTKGLTPGLRITGGVEQSLSRDDLRTFFLILFLVTKPGM